MSKAVKINIHKSMVKPVVLYGSETWAVTDGYEKNGYRGEKNIKNVTWTGGRERNMENKK
jgi:hypothetical protein